MLFLDALGSLGENQRNKSKQKQLSTRGKKRLEHKVNNVRNSVNVTQYQDECRKTSDNASLNFSPVPRVAQKIRET